MEPNYFCYGLRDSQLQFVNAAITFFCLEGVQLHIFCLSLSVCHRCLLCRPNYPEPPQTQTLYRAQMSQELEKM